MRGTNTLATLRRTLSAARETIAAADAILHTGDAVHDEAGGYLWLQRELGSFDKPVLCVFGTRDPILGKACACRAITTIHSRCANCCPRRSNTAGIGISAGGGS